MKPPPRLDNYKRDTKNDDLENLSKLASFWGKEEFEKMAENSLWKNPVAGSHDVGFMTSSFQASPRKPFNL